MYPLPTALLEDWMRRYYFRVELDLGSSGVQDWSMAELRELLEIDYSEIDALVFHDSETLGGAGLRQAIAERWTHGDVNRVMATHGSTEANFLVMTALLRPGDEVVVLDPCYPQLFAIAEAIGCHLKRWPLRWERGFCGSLDDARAVIGEKTRMVVVNFPHNPTGASISADEQIELIDLVSRAGAYLIWDGAFADLTFDTPKLPDPVLMYDRAISMGTLSKAYGLPGLRVGWCLASPETLAKMVTVRDYLTLHLSPLVELLAAKAIAKADLLTGLRLAQARHNLGILDRWIAMQDGRVEWARPRGGVTAFVRFPQVMDVEAFCIDLAETERVMLVPGTCFGYHKHARLGFGGPTPAFEEGLRRVGGAIAAAAGKFVAARARADKAHVALPKGI